MTLYAYTDGASRGNPGQSGIGIVVKNEQGKRILTVSAYIGIATNNLAEYTALLTLLKRLQLVQFQHLLVHSDSELMVRQMNGEYKIKNPQISALHKMITEILRSSAYSFEIKHVPREANSEADQLANAGIESRVRVEDQTA